MKEALRIAALPIYVLILAYPLPVMAQEAEEPSIIIGNDEIAISGVVIDVDAGSFTVSSAGSEMKINTEDMDIADLNELITEGMAVEVAGSLNNAAPGIRAEEIRVLGIVQNDNLGLSDSSSKNLLPRGTSPLVNQEASPIFMPNK